MSKPNATTPPLTIDLNLEDEDSIKRAAEALGTTPESVRTTILFAQQVMETAEAQELTRGQMVTALMSVLTLMIKACGTTDEQGEFCFRLFEGLWASCDLPTKTPFGVEGPLPSLSLLSPTDDEQVH
jgi:uncharacterized protein (DUF1778 family)